MSTPRTDAAMCVLHPGVQPSVWYVQATVCREIERDLAAAQATIARQAEERDELAEALRPLANAWAHTSLRYERIGSDWHQRMPGHWSWNPRLTVEDARRAHTLLARLDAEKELKNGKYMVDKPMKGRQPYARQAGAEAAYFRLRGFGFFFAISSRDLTGIASIRRASSSMDINGSFSRVCGSGLGLVMSVNPD